MGISFTATNSTLARMVGSFIGSGSRGRRAGAPGVDPQQPQFAIEFDDAAMSLHLPDHVLDLGQPDATGALQETVALLRQRAGAPGGANFAWWLSDLSRRLARPSWPEEALATSDEAPALDP